MKILIMLLIQQVFMYDGMDLQIIKAYIIMRLPLVVLMIQQILRHGRNQSFKKIFRSRI